MADIRSCFKCGHTCIAGKDAIYQYENDDVKLVCDKCSGVVRCGRCGGIIGPNGYCGYCYELNLESDVSAWLEKWQG